MRIAEIDAQAVSLPFRFSFGHSLASRNKSSNVVVRATVVAGDGKRYTGYGESVPRDYVTGETVEGALQSITDRYMPELTDFEFEAPLDCLKFLRSTFTRQGLEEAPLGASWCAVELAIIDAVARANGLNMASLLSLYDATRLASQQDAGEGRGGSTGMASVLNSIEYGGVLPFGNLAAWVSILTFFRWYGFRTVKLKVGRNWDHDLFKLRLARAILGPGVVLRIDANCAWTVDETLYFAEKMRKYNVTSIEQPVDAEDLNGMIQLTAELPETIVADESLCTLQQARVLIESRACDAFNIRLSKVGGPLAACEMADLARDNGLSVLLGAQVGESAILTSAGRAWASVKGPFDNCEGSFNRYLLKQDLSREDVTFSRAGHARTLAGPGLGITVDERLLRRYTETRPLRGSKKSSKPVHH